MKSYRPEELFDAEGRLVPELRALSPVGTRRMSANLHANGGLLRKALKTTEAIMAKSENFYLLVKILNTYVYYFTIEAEFMNVQDINDLLSFIKETIDEMEDQKPAQAGLKALTNTKNAIREKASQDSRFGLIQL